MQYLYKDYIADEEGNQRTANFAPGKLLEGVTKRRSLLLFLKFGTEVAL